MKVYLAGPMRGYENFNFPSFMKAAEFLRAHGDEVFNPAENDIEKGYVTIDEGNVVSCDVPNVMRKCILDDLTFIINEADAVALLPGWEASKGSNAEVATAIFLGLPLWQLSEYQVNNEQQEAASAA
jgi:Domain of unknown function (DUF4406)